MSIETQETVHGWINETFPGTDPDSPRKAIRALEEMVELCLASGANYEEIRNAVDRNRKDHRGRDDHSRTYEPGKIPAEAADVLIVLYGVAGMRGFDLHAEVDRKMAVNRARKWKANGDGTGYHIKEESPADA
jgi:NTP pyrophosphatase (non-canonical NTP hydrolase)